MLLEGLQADRERLAGLCRRYGVITEHVPSLLTHLGALIAGLEQEVNWQEDDTEA